MSEFQPSWRSTYLVLLPVRVKSVFRAPVPAYWTDTMFAWSAHVFLKTASKVGFDLRTDAELAVPPGGRTPKSRKSRVRFSVAISDCTTFVRSRQSMQLVLKTPSCLLVTARPLVVSMAKYPKSYLANRSTRIESRSYLIFEHSLWKSK